MDPSHSRTREDSAISSVQSSSSELEAMGSKSDKQLYFCKRCTRTVDQQRRFLEDSIIVHLRAR